MGTTNVSSGVTDTVTTNLPASDSYNVESGGTLDVNHGGTVSGLITILSSGVTSVASGGHTLSTLVEGGGEQAIVGGTVSTTTVENSGIQDIGSGSAVGTIVQAGGSQVMLGGIASETTLSGGTEFADGGIASTTTVDEGAVQSVAVFGLLGHIGVAGTAVSAAVESGGSQVVAVGGQGFIPTASDTSVEAGGQQWVEGGGSDDGMAIDTFLYGGTQFVGSYTYLESLSGGSASYTYIFDGAVQSIDVGGSTTLTYVEYGTQYIYDGSATSNIISSGGTQYDYGLATDNLIYGGYELVSGFEISALGEEVLDDGSAISTTISSGGTQSVLFDPTEGLTPVASITTVDAGGLQWVSNGKAISTTVYLSGEQNVYGDISARAIDTILNGGFQNLYDGAVASTTVVDSGYQDVFLAGTAISTRITNTGTQALDGIDTYSESSTVLNGGLEFVSGNAITSSAVISSGGTEQVAFGGTALGTTISSGGTEIINSGGTDGAAVIESGGTQLDYGLANAAIVNQQGLQEVLSGGSASGTLVAFNALQYIGSDGTAIDTQLQFGGAEEVFGTDLGASVSGTQYDFGTASGGTTFTSGYQLVALGAVASDMTVSSGGQQYIGAGGTALATDIASQGAQVVFGSALAAAVSATQYDFAYTSGGTTYNGAEQLVAPGATAFGMTIMSGGLQYVGSGGTALSTNVASQGAQEVFGLAMVGVLSGTQYDFGVVSFGAIDNGGYQLVAPGAEAFGAVVYSGGEQYIGSGGTALETNIAVKGAEVIFGSDGGALVSGTQYVFGVASGGYIFDGGSQQVELGATALYMTVSSFGLQDVGAGGTASGTVIMSQGAQLLHGTDLGDTISGTQYVYGLASGTVAATGGYQLVSSGGTISAANISGGAIEMMSGASNGSAPITFTGAGELILDASQSFSGTVAGFDSASQGDSIDFADISYVGAGSAGATTVTWTPSGSGSGTLTVSEGGQTANVTLLGQYTGTFNASAVGGGTFVTYAAAAGVTELNPSVLAMTPHT